jgi:galactokinase
VSPARRTTGPGRVNLIGDHTDYNQGLALPMAIDLGVTVSFTPSDQLDIHVSSSAFGSVVLPLDIAPDRGSLAAIEPAWARMIGAMIAMSRPERGGTLRIESTLPIGSGLSSSAALCVALAEAFGVGGSPAAVARLCREAEHRSGVPVGLMDPLVCAGGRRGHGLLIDFSTLGSEPVPLPPGIEVVVIDSGHPRALRDSEYAARVAECEAAAAIIGPLGLATGGDLAGLRDPLLRRRARHVVTECLRVGRFALALRGDDLVGAGVLMNESHRSLSEKFAVSTPEVDALVARVASLPGVFGARMTGAGFGGCVVALTRPGAIDTAGWDTPAWRVEASDGTVASRP